MLHGRNKGDVESENGLSASSPGSPAPGGTCAERAVAAGSLPMPHVVGVRDHRPRDQLHSFCWVSRATYLPQSV